MDPSDRACEKQFEMPEIFIDRGCDLLTIERVDFKSMGRWVYMYSEIVVEGFDFGVVYGSRI